MLWMCDYTNNDGSIQIAFGVGASPVVGWTAVNYALGGGSSITKDHEQTSNWVAALPKGVL